jgi:YidC/Oxa1 family membrane protein insertase
MSGIWHTLVYEPLYNILIGFVALVPGHSVGLGIILLTLSVKLALWPLTAKSILAQRAMRELEPELRKIRETYKDKQEQALKTMELYQKKGVTPFSGCLPILIQIPVVFGLYFVFMKGLVIDPAQIYSFVPAPAELDLHFFTLDLAAKSLFLAILAGGSQFYQAHLSLGSNPLPKPVEGKKPSLQDDIARSMQMQMRYVFPVLIGVVAFSTSAAVALYWATSNMLGIAQELWMKLRIAKT